MRAESPEEWANHIIKDMIAMNDLGKYSDKAISSDVTVNFLMVESVKDVKVENDILSMKINHGNGKYCTILKFQFIEREGKFFLVFTVPYVEEVFGKKQYFINPWIEKISDCN